MSEPRPRLQLLPQGKCVGAGFLYFEAFFMDLCCLYREGALYGNIILKKGALPPE